MNSYPINDSSSFIIAQTTNFGWWFLKPGGPFMHGAYYVHSDTLTDYGKIEILLNGQTNWINILEDTLYHFLGASNKPILTGNSNGWQTFTLNFYALADSINLPLNWQDTVFLRFTFITDSVQTNKDGLMFDNFYFIDFWDSVEEIYENILPSKAFPNPSKDYLTILPLSDHRYRSLQLTITDGLGRTVLHDQFLKGDIIRIKTSVLIPGLYHYRMSYDEGVYYSTGKFQKE